MSARERRRRSLARTCSREGHARLHGPVRLGSRSDGRSRTRAMRVARTVLKPTRTTQASKQASSSVAGVSRCRERRGMPRRDLSEELEEALGRALGSWNYCLASDHHHDLGVAQLDVHLAIVASYPARASERASYLLSNESSRAQRARHRIPKLMEMSRKSKNLRPSTRWSCSRHWSMKRRSLVDSGASFIELVCGVWWWRWWLG